LFTAFETLPAFDQARLGTKEAPGQDFGSGTIAASKKKEFSAMFHKAFTIALVSIGLVAPITQTVLAAEFKLGSRFQDADGDLIADAPTDPGKQMDPGTLIFAYTPVEDPSV
jgi:hypothetical protein